MITASYLKHIRSDYQTGLPTLDQARITEWSDYADWSAFCEGFLATATYPTISQTKFETYGWTPTLFAEGPNAKGVQGHWRRSSAVCDVLTLFVADLDNHQPDQPKTSFEELSAMLTSLGLNHLLYTSFSHKPDHHKVRIVVPVSRDITCDEAFKIFMVFNAALNFQLDGSIYDPADYLYGPHSASQTHIEAGLAPIDVEAFLAAADALPDATKAKMQRKQSGHGREPTPAELANIQKRLADMSVSDEVSIHNPKVFNPKWMNDLRQVSAGGSKSRTILSLLAKVWVKNQGQLSKGDMWLIYMQLDAEYGGYCQSKYGRAACMRDIEAAMRAVAK